MCIDPGLSVLLKERDISGFRFGMPKAGIPRESKSEIRIRKHSGTGAERELCFWSDDGFRA